MPRGFSILPTKTKNIEVNVGKDSNIWSIRVMFMSWEDWRNKKTGCSRIKLRLLHIHGWVWRHFLPMFFFDLGISIPPGQWKNEDYWLFRKLTMENQRFEDVSPIKHDDFPRSSEFSEVQYHHRVEMPLQPTLWVCFGGDSLLKSLSYSFYRWGHLHFRSLIFCCLVRMNQD